MSDLYLIAHIVRGQPAFDIAEPYEDGWIIPTSGHVAHPYWHSNLHHMLQIWDQHFMKDNIKIVSNNGPIGPPPADWPDHYACNDKSRPSGRSLLALLGLRRPMLRR